MSDGAEESLPTLDVYSLHLRNHFRGELTDSVCMSRHHGPPQVWSVRLDDRDTAECTVEQDSLYFDQAIVDEIKASRTAVEDVAGAKQPAG